ncbi:DUF6083 domain-containing protein [Streptomyces sp. NPDC056821]|uniref:DUF6083 domain-containing protein n=1 Tax=unclassified Streptomyces TaxID=2593676 RepID=UPI0036993F6B
MHGRATPPVWLVHPRRDVFRPERARGPTPPVPGGHRRHVDNDGTAWNGDLEEPSPGTTCRIPHQLACPDLTPDEIEPWRWLASVREGNARRAREKADAAGCPECLPDTG